MDESRREPAGAHPTRGDGIGRERFDAVLFDLDGVLTDTAALHARCWKSVFDELLEREAGKRGEPFRPFDPGSDYRLHVDGKPRLAGVRDFLGSRGIQLPEGSSTSLPEEDSVHGVALRKDALFERALADGGIEAYEDSLRWLRALRAEGLRTAVVSASHHCAEVLRAAGIADLFEVRVDGNVADRLGLAGKPAPDTFLEAARELGVPPARAVVVEDALAGVRAGRAGGFGLVIGVARGSDPEALRAAGADRAVRELTELLP